MHARRAAFIIPPVLALLVAGCTTGALEGVAEPELPATTEARPSAKPVMADAGDAAAIAAPVMSLAGVASGGAAAMFDGFGGGEATAGWAKLDRLIAAYAAHYQVPEALVRRVVKRESNFRPEARNGPYWGLMQIRHDTARTMGYRGPASGLLDAETNLKYAVRYLRGAYLTAGGNHDQAVRFYARGYYYDAKRKGLLDETGLGRDRKR